MKKALLFFAVALFLGVIAVPTYSFISNNPVIVHDDPPKTKEVKTTEKKSEEKATKTKKDKEACKKDCTKACCDKSAIKSCCSKDKKKN